MATERNCRSLGFARDDKGKVCDKGGGRLLVFDSILRIREDSWRPKQTADPSASLGMTKERFATRGLRRLLVFHPSRIREDSWRPKETADPSASLGMTKERFATRGLRRLLVFDSILRIREDSWRPKETADPSASLEMTKVRFATKGASEATGLRFHPQDS